ncbi:MAG: AIPR family protein [Candidatus Bathyarchaeia archaeon]
MREAITRLKDNYGWTQDADAFAHWAICHVSDLSEREVYEEVHVGSKGDKSLDGFYIEQDDKTVQLFQCKYHEGSGSYGDRAAITDFVNVLNRLRDEKASKEFSNTEIRRCARRYRNAISDQYKVTMHFIVYASTTPSVVDDAKVIRKNLPPRHTFELWNYKRLEYLYLEQIAYDEPITETVTIKLADPQHLEMSTQKADAAVVSVPLDAFYELRKNYGRRLFSRDVRYYLGETPINRQIKKTLDSPTDRPFFWYYNNGISLSCSDYHIDEKRRVIEVKEPQIINGCQTAESIFNFGEEMGSHNLAKGSLLARVIKTKDKQLGQNITARTNTQNPQSMRNLCGNLESQTKLKELFDDLNPAFFYQTKDGEWDSLPNFRKDRYTYREDGAVRVIDNVDAAAAYIAYVRDDDKLNPVEARRKQYEVFDITKDFYGEIFPEEPDSPHMYLVPSLLLMYTEKRLKKIRKELGTRSPKTQDEQVADEIKGSVRYAKWFIVGAIAWLVRSYYSIKRLDESTAKLLYKQIGDIRAPSDLGNYMLDFAIDLVEEYSDEEQRRDDEFDPALAYRQAQVWKNLKRKAERNYRRLTDRCAFKSELFPKP